MRASTHATLRSFTFAVLVSLVVALVIACLSPFSVASAASTGGSNAHSAATAKDTRLITYPGRFGVSVWRNEGDLKRLTGAPSDLKQFVRHRLDVLWGDVDRRPVCAHTPLIVVKRIRTDGFAKITDEGVFPHGPGTNSCATGGHAAIFATVAGKWREVLGTQEGYSCRDLRALGIPSSIAGHTCLTPGGHVKPYHHR
jgi:hypothetical protein